MAQKQTGVNSKSLEGQYTKNPPKEVNGELVEKNSTPHYTILRKCPQNARIRVCPTPHISSIENASVGSQSLTKTKPANVRSVLGRTTHGKQKTGQKSVEVGVRLDTQQKC